MTKRTRIYTRTGDDGTTGLVGGQRIDKDAARIEAYGTVDELSSAIGIARAELDAIRRGRALDQARALAVANELDAWLAWVQDLLFNVGSRLATLPSDRPRAMPDLGDADVAALERAIDHAERDLKPLSTFIHPGGTRAGAALHLARTITRRAERRILALSREEDTERTSLRYVNRLSDALFVWARWINHAIGQPEHHWNHEPRPPE